MLNALHVFHGVVNDPSFRDTPFLVFLNKKDLFEQKLKAGTMIKAVPSFKDYKGGTSVSAGIKYFTKKFEKINKVKGRPLKFHATCATDSSNVKKIFDACFDVFKNMVVSSWD